MEEEKKHDEDFVLCERMKNLLDETEPLDFKLSSIRGRRRTSLSKKLYGLTDNEREYMRLYVAKKRKGDKHYKHEGVDRKDSGVLCRGEQFSEME